MPQHGAFYYQEETTMQPNSNTLLLILACGLVLALFVLATTTEAVAYAFLGLLAGLFLAFAYNR